MTDLARCLADKTRLRILSLLLARPLCVCHLQDALELSQVRISKHLAYLRQHGLVDRHRDRNWMIYHFTLERNREHDAVRYFLLQALAIDPELKQDRQRLKQTYASCQIKPASPRAWFLQLNSNL